MNPDSDEPMYTVNDNQNTDESQPNKVKVGLMNTRSNGQIKVTAFVKETPFQAIVDTGCKHRIEKKWPDLCLKPTKTRTFPFDCEKPIQLLGKFETAVENNNKITVTTIYVAAGKSGCLLKFETAEELGFITVHVNKIDTDHQTLATNAKHSVHDTNVNQDITVSNSDTENTFTHPDANINKLLLKHQQVFKGNGCLNDHLVELDIDKSFRPVIQPQMRVPFHMRKLVEKKLIELQEEDIIEPVTSDEGAPWVSPIVVVPKKSGQIRLCIDMRTPNRAIQRVRYLMPTVQDVEDVKVELNNERYFTKLDLREAYHQLVFTQTADI